MKSNDPSQNDKMSAWDVFVVKSHVSSKPCLEALPHSILQTTLAGHRLGAF